MRLDAHSIPSASPTKCACEPTPNPKHAPAKLSGVRCELHSLSNNPSVCSVCVPLRFLPCSEDNYVAKHTVEGASEGWEKSVTPVNREWRAEKSSKHAFFPAVELYPEDAMSFVMK